MPVFSESSNKRLATCHPDLVVVAYEAIKYVDYGIAVGARGKIDQNNAYKHGLSKTPWPQSKHNARIILPDDEKDEYPDLRELSEAFDFFPSPTDWKILWPFAYVAGVIMTIGDQLYREGKIKHKLRSGGNWDMDYQIVKQPFNDLGHIELVTNK